MMKHLRLRKSFEDTLCEMFYRYIEENVPDKSHHKHPLLTMVQDNNIHNPDELRTYLTEMIEVSSSLSDSGYTEFFLKHYTKLLRTAKKYLQH